MAEGRVLLVEDEVTNRTLLETWLGSQGYQVTSADCGEKAISAVNEEAPDIILLDIVMPGIDGFGVLEHVRQSYDMNALPVIMLTARDESDDVIRAFRIGANDYAKKPVDFQVLQKRLETHLQHKSGDARTLGTFEIEKKLGAGGMGVVYSAIQTQNGSRVALKVLHRSMTFDDEYVSRFMREARLASRIDHPAIVKIFDCGRMDETYFLSMEFVDGQNLFDISCDGPLGIKDTIQIAQQVARGLHALAAEGIMHRDIKPENILVCADMTAKITDFGIAREIQSDHRLTEPGVGFGSLAYVSPEQMVGRGDERADIYSLGSTLFFMLTANDPFSTDQPPEVILNSKMKAPPLVKDVRDDIPQALSDLIARMMMPNEKERLGSYDELIRELDAIGRTLGLAGGEEDAPPGPGPKTAAGPALARSPTTRSWQSKAIVVGIIGLVVALASLAVWHLLA